MLNILNENFYVYIFNVLCVAMGLPAEGVQKLYRNDINEVARFLNEKHKDHYLIFNLSQIRYNFKKFNEQVIDFGFPDHHPPELRNLFVLCSSMKKYLDANSENVVVVHCKAGKGRTGVACCCLLLYCGICTSAEEALRLFATRRSTTIKGGVAVPSQRRYVEYFDRIINRDDTPSVAPLKV